MCIKCVIRKMAEELGGVRLEKRAIGSVTEDQLARLAQIEADHKALDKAGEAIIKAAEVALNEALAPIAEKENELEKAHHALWAEMAEQHGVTYDREETFTVDHETNTLYQEVAAVADEETEAPQGEGVH